jgi:pSer/pThr/pTyr-binding forkhead associated (FHA) protein
VQPDYAARAAQLERAEFIKAYPWVFLVSTAGEIIEPAGPQKTGIIERIEDPDTTLDGDETVEPVQGPQLVMAVRKVQSTFGNMITVGRTSNCDVVIRDVTVSKFHAFFRIGSDGSVELGDAGSRNGTWVDKTKLEPKGPVVPVPLGTNVRFGSLVFQLVNGGGCWDFLRRKR